MYINTIGATTERVYKLLQLVDYSHGISFSVIPSYSMRDVILKAADEKSASINKTQSWLVYHMAKGVAANLRLQ